MAYVVFTGLATLALTLAVTLRRRELAWSRERPERA